MGSSCQTCQNHSQLTPIGVNFEKISVANDNIIKIQSRCRQHLAIKKTKTRIKGEIINFKSKIPFPKVSRKEIEAIRWAQLIQIENNFNKAYGNYTQSSTSSSSNASFSSSSSSGNKDNKDNNNNNNNITNANCNSNNEASNLFIFSMPAVLYQSLIYQGQWKYNSLTNTFIPYGIGCIIKQTGLKIESFFKDLEPVALTSRIYYPNGRIYQGEVKHISSQYLPHGKGQIHLSSGIFEMNFDKGLPIGKFTFESSNKDYHVKGGFTQSKMNRDIEITYPDGKKYKGPFNYDNKNFTIKEIKSNDQRKEMKYILISDSVFSFLDYYDIATIQQIPNQLIQNKIKDNCFNIKLNHYITDNHHLNQLYQAYNCKIKNIEQLLNHINHQLFIPLSAYSTNGGIIDYETHYANIFNPSNQKIYFSNCLYEKTRKVSNIFIKGIINHIIYDDIKFGNKTDIALLYNNFQERYTIDYYNSDVFDANVYDALSAMKKTLHFFSIHEIRIKIDITPNDSLVLTNPVKSFAVYIKHSTFAKDKGVAQENNEEFVLKDRQEQNGIQDKWKEYIDDSEDIKPIHYIDNEECTIIEFDSCNKNGLFLFVEMKTYNTEVVYRCKEKMKHIGKEVKIVLFDQQISMQNVAKCGIDFGTILFKGNLIEMVTDSK